MTFDPFVPAPTNQTAADSTAPDKRKRRRTTKAAATVERNAAKPAASQGRTGAKKPRRKQAAPAQPAASGVARMVTALAGVKPEDAAVITPILNAIEAAPKKVRERVIEVLRKLYA